MHIGMTVNTAGLCFGKDKGRVTYFAINSLVLACKWQSGLVMIERVNRFIQLPSF
jgi:hypothetical protein